ncbi:MAG TPA: ATPase, T2SS/T4P/T4SS family [Actinomycetota bacterium]|nr:ATPase, T2SS/T4P/T4SS family [Actinomycetota bacterium]
MPKSQRLGEVLLEAGLITQDVLDAALVHQRQGEDAAGRRVRLGTVLLDMGVVSEEGLAHALSMQLGIPFVDLTSVAVDPDLLQLIPRRTADRLGVVPVDRTEAGILIAMADPTDVVALDDVRVTARAGTIRAAVATQSAVRDAIDRFYSLDSATTDVVNRLGEAADVEVVVATAPEEPVEDLASSGQAAPIVRLANAILADGVRARATDVHIEPQQSEVTVRYRIDGLLREVMTLPKTVHAALVSRLKIMATMDIAERRRPQDGRARVVVSGSDVSLRVSTIPTMRGEKVVLRLLRQGEETVSLEETGMTLDQLALVRDALSQPQGFVLFTGPTGSGKTTSMYATLLEKKSPEVNIVTLEDPIEYQIRGISQMQIDDKTGLSFARGLRSVLRQDPNVIMVGEIRDVETAHISLQAAMTGHLVFSTVHTNDAASAVTRLVDMGVESFLVAQALSLIVAQRLVRVICPHCKQEAPPSEAALKRLGLAPDTLAGVTLYRGAGCETCGFTGFLGRTGIFEVLPIRRQMREQINAQAAEGVLSAGARAAGVRSLLEAGLEKVRAGITTLDEVQREVQIERQPDRPRCPSCRNEVDPAFVVCPYCQLNLGPASCGSCGREVAADWNICPYCRAELDPAAPAAANPHTPGRARVLFVDDDPSLIQLAHAMFDDDFEVLDASSGEDAIRRAAVERPDLILLDLHMPGIGGLEVAKRLRGSAATSMIPLIMLTGDDSGEIEGLRAGVDDYIVKPFDEDRLRARIERALRLAARVATG